jgi:ketosteroid isomerase-like protein
MRILHALAPLAILVLGGFAQAPDVDQATLRAVADRFDRAQLSQDRPALERLIADDLILIGSDGTRQNKRQFIEGFVAPGLHFEMATPTDRYFIPLGPDAGIAGGDIVLRGTSDGTPFATRLRFSDTFRRIDGEWLAVHVEATRVPEGRPQP